MSSQIKRQVFTRWDRQQALVIGTHLRKTRGIFLAKQALGITKLKIGRRQPWHCSIVTPFNAQPYDESAR
jgi:hypothetical protein